MNPKRFFAVLALAVSSITPLAVAQTSSLVSQLSSKLAVTPTQARGGAGTLFSLAKSRLSEDEFGKVSSAVPGMGKYLAAAPKPEPSSEMSGLEKLSGMSELGRMGEAASAFHKLGMPPSMIVKFLPVMSKYVKARGGADTAGLLEKALK